MGGNFRPRAGSDKADGSRAEPSARPEQPPGAPQVPWARRRRPESYDDLDDRTHHGEDQAHTGLLLLILFIHFREMIPQIIHIAQKGKLKSLLDQVAARQQGPAA